MKTYAVAASTIISKKKFNVALFPVMKFTTYLVKSINVIT